VKGETTADIASIGISITLLQKIIFFFDQNGELIPLLFKDRKLVIKNLAKRTV
jgi:hypothetical protein